MKLPSKKIIYLGIGCLFLVLLIFVLKNYDLSSPSNTLSYQAGTSSDLDNGKDTDGDGLSDWQEINIWKTDPTNPDTDHDGTLDGNEVTVGRDPDKAGPADELGKNDPRTIAAVKAQIEGGSANDNNLTENLSKSFFANYLSAQDSSGGLDQNAEVNVVQNSLGNLNLPTLAQKYTLDSLTLIDPTPEQIKNFGNSLASTEKTNLSGVINQKNNPEAFGALIEAYKNNAEDLADIPVPREIASTYLQIINYDNQLSISLNDIQNYNVDPVRALLGIKTYQAIEAAEPALYKNIAIYFKNNGIIFTNNDSGYIWNNY